MEEENILEQMITTHQMQLLKTALPYVNIEEQKFLSVYIKFKEFTNTFLLFQNSEQTSQLKIQSTQANPKNMTSLLADLKKACTKEEAQVIDLMQNFIQVSKLYQTYQEIQPESDGKLSPQDILSAMLTPQQKQMFEMYKGLF